MLTIGIITEYNPFHNGHQRQIERLREAFSRYQPEEEVTVVSLMSGNFVQRGDIALLPKGYRAIAAVKGGADLVLELPYPYSGACAEVFASAGVYLLDRLGVDYLAFGSESGDLVLLEETARNLSLPEFESALSSRIAASPDRAYATLRDEVYADCFGKRPPDQPNDILGIAYLTALKKQQSRMKPFVVKREGRESATASRAAAFAEDGEALDYLVPKDSRLLLEENALVSLKTLEKAVLAMLRLASPSDYADIADLPVGLAERMITLSKRYDHLEAFLEACATKMYTNARIRRSLLSCLLGVTRERLAEMPAFTRLLGANEKGRAFLSKVDFAILTRAGDYRAFDEAVQKQVLFADRADSFYALADENARLVKPFIL